MKTLDKKVSERVLKVSDRCDRCGAQAFVKAEMVNGELFFCAHHFRKAEDAIRKVSFTIVDEREFVS